MKYKREDKSAETNKRENATQKRQNKPKVEDIFYRPPTTIYRVFLPTLIRRNDAPCSALKFGKEVSTARNESREKTIVRRLT